MSEKTSKKAPYMTETKTFDPANAVAEPFYGLGAPRGAWLGLRYEWE